MLLVGSTGCEDFLTKDHPTATTDDKFWKTMNECENALNQCRSWPKAGYGGDDLGFVCMEGMTGQYVFLVQFRAAYRHDGKRFFGSSYIQQFTLFVGIDILDMALLLSENPSLLSFFGTCGCGLFLG